MLNYQEIVSPGDHMVLLYNDVVKPVVDFMVASLDRNERCIYVSGDTNMDMLIETLGEYIDIENRIEKNDLFLLSKEDAYSKDGEFVPDKMIELLLKLSEESLNLGYSGISITGELSWVLNYGDGIDKIIEYEWKLNERVFVKKELTALCRYNLNKFDDTMIANIIQLHPIIVYKGKIHENPYYLPPEGFKEDNLPKYQVETWLKNIDEFTNVKSKFERDIRKIESESTAKSDFLSRMSHDMRTPLSAIISLSEFGMEEDDEIKNDKYFSEIKMSAEYLLSLMNDILDYQKLKNSKVEINKSCVDVSKLLKNIYGMIKPQADKKSISMKMESVNYVKDCNQCMIDSKRVSQILINILNNSVKYTEPGGSINWYSYIESKNGKDYLVNTISDTGVGMSKKFQRHMFESFAQEENILTQSEGGTGLGLPIVKQLVELMNGKVDVESELKVGTTIKVSIPIDRSKKKLDKIPNLENKKILICEDNEINAQILMKHLEKTKALIGVAKNGIEAISMAKEVDYDLILMDLRMPIMNGIEASQEIHKFNKEVPIVIVSADDMDLIKEANAFLAKPIDKNKLYETIEKLI